MFELKYSSAAVSCLLTNIKTCELQAYILIDQSGSYLAAWDRRGGAHQKLMPSLQECRHLGSMKIREFSIVRERRHVTPCLSSAHSSTGYCEPVCGQREIGRFGVQDLYVDVYDYSEPSGTTDCSGTMSGTKKCDVMFKLRPFVHWLLSTRHRSVNNVKPFELRFG